VATQAATFLVYLPLALFAADLSFDCGCLLASRAWLAGLGAKDSESGSTREVVEPGCERVPSGLLSPQTQPDVTVAPVGMHLVGVIKDHPVFAWGTFERIGKRPRTCLPAWTQNRPAHQRARLYVL
jgi:hypothetical protein